MESHGTVERSPHQAWQRCDKVAIRRYGWGMASLLDAAQRTFDPGERRRLGGFFGLVVLLHVLGWGMLLAYGIGHPALLGLGGLAYTFGLRHAFDADHIAAIDNTTRKLLQQGRRPVGVGFFFSLGHSTIVFALSATLAVSARVVHSEIPALQRYGAAIGTGVSGTFLWIIGVLNLIVLLDIVRIFREMR